MFFGLIKTKKEREKELIDLINKAKYNQVLTTKVTNTLKIVTVGASRQLDRAEQKELAEHNPYVHSYIEEGLARELADKMIDKQLIEWESEVDSMGGVTLYARVRVCNEPKFESGLSGE
jgi:hypothetical protein